MAIQIINTGTSANAGNGDSIRTAFNKVNNNFDFLNGIVVGTSTNFNSGVRDVVKPMLIHDAHRGLTAAYSTLNDRIILTVSEVAESTFNNIRVLNTATLRDVVMTGTVTMGFIQGFDDVNIIKYADDGSLNFRMKNTYGIGSSEINLLDERVGSFNIVHQNSGANNEFLSAGQNYIYDDRGRAINIGRGGNINFYSDQNWEGYTVPALSISNTGTVVVNSALNITNDNFKLGGNQVSVVGNTILINGIETTGITDHLTAGEFTATLTTAGNLILPGNARLEYGSFVQPGQTVTNYGATFSSDGPFSGAGSIYFDGSSRVEVAGGSHFNLNTGTYTIEWFQKPTVINTGSEYTVYILGTLDNQRLQAFNTYELGTIVTSAVLEGNYELSAPYITDFLNTWSHVAIVKKPDIYSVFINGVQTFTTATEFWPTPVTTTSNLVIGAAELYSEYQNTFTGYISNMRWEAREVYTATFVPPTSILTATSNTRLLLAAEDSNNYLWDTAGIVLETPQALTIAVGTSSLILNQYGMLTLDQQGAYNQLTVPGTLFRIDTDQPNYTQMTLQNINSNITATSDLIFVRDNGDVELGTGFLDIGINSSNYVEEEMFGIHGAGSAYMFTNDADLVIGTQNPGKRLIFHAGGSTALDSAGYVDDYTWQFNRSVQTIFGTPGPLNFTIQNTSNNSAAQAVYQARNDLGAYVHFGINSSNPVAFYGNIGPGESFFHNHNTTATLSIGSEGNLVFYSNEITGFSGTATLTMSRVDRSSTFGGDLLPDADLAHDLGSLTQQWRSLYVGTSTIYLGGVSLSVSGTTLTIDGSPITGGGGVGLQGIQGEPGPQGPAGSTGTQGIQGIEGPQGIQGIQGAQGPIGNTGTQGIQGPIGDTGAQGISLVLIGSTDTVTVETVGVGAPGQGWINTTDGDVYFWNTLTTVWENIGPIVGPEGPQGPQGVQGEQGIQGIEGPEGPQGSTGTQGIQGIEGPAGPQGIQGIEGPQGTTGTTGAQGPIGPEGPQGDVGPQGERAQEDRLTTGSYSIVLGSDGVITLPANGSIEQNFSWTRTSTSSINTSTPTVVWTANTNTVSGAKLMIQVEANEIGDATGWHSQVADTIIASRGYAVSASGPLGDPAMTVFGVTHTSVDPLTTFTVQRNPATKLIEVVGTITTATTAASLRIYSVETATRD